MLEYIGVFDEDVTGNSFCEVRRRLGPTPLDKVGGADATVEGCAAPEVDNVCAADVFAKNEDGGSSRSLPLFLPW